MGFFRRLIGVKPNTPAENAAAEPPQSAPEVPQQNIKTVEAPAIDLGVPGATRQLPPIETSMTKPGKHLIAGLNSDVGMVRNNNQDSLFAMFSSQVSTDGLPDFGLFVVADGMGGHHDGERASALASRVIARHMIAEFYLKLLDYKSSGDEKPVVAEVLSEAVQLANDTVAAEIPEGGTTVTAAAVVGDLAYIAHVGDSRAYLITADGIEQITRDHSLVQRLIELGQLTQEEAAAHNQRNVLYRAIGQTEHLEIDTATRRLPGGSRLLLCSDGLWNQVPEDKLLQTIMAAKSPQDACDRLITIANERGGNDNITCILIQVPG